MQFPCLVLFLLLQQSLNLLFWGVRKMICDNPGCDHDGSGWEKHNQGRVICPTSAQLLLSSIHLCSKGECFVAQVASGLIGTCPPSYIYGSLSSCSAANKSILVMGPLPVFTSFKAALMARLLAGCSCLQFADGAQLVGWYKWTQFAESSSHYDASNKTGYNSTEKSEKPIPLKSPFCWISIVVELMQ